MYPDTPSIPPAPQPHNKGQRWRPPSNQSASVYSTACSVCRSCRQNQCLTILTRMKPSNYSHLRLHRMWLVKVAAVFVTHFSRCKSSQLSFNHGKMAFPVISWHSYLCSTWRDQAPVWKMVKLKQIGALSQYTLYDGSINQAVTIRTFDWSRCGNYTLKYIDLCVLHSAAG